MTGSYENYHLERADAEDRMAERADDPATVRAHRDLAAMHRLRAAMQNDGPMVSEPQPAL